MYRRRNDGRVFKGRNFNFTNQWVVPHNLWLCTKYNCHLNVEICSSISAVKYLYKYVYKGPDKVNFTIRAAGNVCTNSEGAETHDEIKNFLEARYISTMECCWRIYSYPMRSQTPNTVRLPIHLEFFQNVTYTEGETCNEILEKNSNTKLTEFFKLNRLSEEARNYLYHEIPNYYRWDARTKKWIRRER